MAPTAPYLAFTLVFVRLADTERWWFGVSGQAPNAIVALINGVGVGVEYYVESLDCM